MDATIWVSAIFGLGACFIAFLQLELMQTQREIMDAQTDLMRKQTELALKQDEIVQAQLAQQPQLRMHVDIDTNVLMMGAFTPTVGTRKADGFTWQFGIRRRLGLEFQVVLAEIGIPLQPDELLHEGYPHDIFRHRVDSALYKGRTVRVAQVRFSQVPTNTEIFFLYQVVWDDGEFPGGGYQIQVVSFDQHPLPPSPADAS